MIFITEWALIDSEIQKREKCVSSKKYSADGLLHDLEGKLDVTRVIYSNVIPSSQDQTRETQLSP